MMQHMIHDTPIQVANVFGRHAAGAKGETRTNRPSPPRG